MDTDLRIVKQHAEIRRWRIEAETLARHHDETCRCGKTARQVLNEPPAMTWPLGKKADD